MLSQMEQEGMSADERVARALAQAQHTSQDYNETDIDVATFTRLAVEKYRLRFSTKQVVAAFEQPSCH